MKIWVKAILAACLSLEGCGSGLNSAPPPPASDLPRPYSLEWLRNQNPGPGAFWRSFDPGRIIHDSSDQGPWGGCRAMHWSAEKEGTFTETAVKTFAEAKGWHFVDKTSYPSQEVRSWTSAGQAVFPWPEGRDSSPRWIDTDATLLRFDGGWLLVDDDKERKAYGYVLLSADGRQMSFYHVWGE